MSSYLGANVFITGASRGIGLGLVRHCLNAPDVQRVFAGARTPDSAKDLQELAKQNPKVQIVEFDSLNDQTIKAAVKTVEEKVGSEGLSLLINNAGVFLSDGNNSQEPDREAVSKVFNTNVVGIMVACPAFLPLLKKASTEDRPSRILNISSTAGSIEKLQGEGFPHSNATYPASKAALNAYTKFFATSNYSKGTISISMCPGWVQTDMGGQRASLTVDQSCEAILKTLSGLKQSDSGRYMDRNGQTIPY
ncbi:Oxidoreductase, short chain dehydrogenase/reductase family protein [Aphelenchoides besseyi]|nr:Oxidoreductase, short chain dehydrogenase/reductase family protein [Aphelenchoides besseyi]